MDKNKKQKQNLQQLRYDSDVLDELDCSTVLKPNYATTRNYSSYYQINDRFNLFVSVLQQRLKLVCVLSLIEKDSKNTNGPHEDKKNTILRMGNDFLLVLKKNLFHTIKDFFLSLISVFTQPVAHFVPGKSRQEINCIIAPFKSNVNT